MFRKLYKLSKRIYSMVNNYCKMKREPLPGYATDAGVRWVIVCGTGGNRQTADELLRVFVDDLKRIRGMSRD